MTSICVIGYPSTYGGAGTELDHQITCWRLMGIEVHIIPTEEIDEKQRALRVDKRGCIVHGVRNWSACEGLDVISYCNGCFIASLPEIRGYARSTTFAGCMTYPFDQEVEACKAGLIDFSLYQTKHGMELNGMVNSPRQAVVVQPFFDCSQFPMVHLTDDYFGFCRVSRDDPAKFSRHTMRIYSEFKSPVPKSGCILGWSDKVGDIGQCPSYVTCYPPGSFPASKVYAVSHCLIQPQACNENLPRVGMEAMSSGCVPIVDNRGGWKLLVEHGVTGYLIGSPDEYIEVCTEVAHNPAKRRKMACVGRERVETMFGMETANLQWGAFFKLLRDFDRGAS